jgi:hypothetical protein
MIRHLALAILLALIAATPAAAATATRVGSFATGPAGWHSITSPPSTGTTGAGTQHAIYPIQRSEFPTLRTPPDIHLIGCAFCAGHDGGVGTQPN